MIIPTEAVLFINISLVLLILIFVLLGVRKGLLSQLLSIVGLLLALFAAFWISPICAEYIQLWPKDLTPLGDTVLEPIVRMYFNRLVWFLLTFILVRILMAFLRPIFKFITKIPILKQVDGLFGGVFGLIPAACWIIILCLVLNFPYFENGKEIINSTLLVTVQDMTSKVIQTLDQPLLESGIIEALEKGDFDFSEQDEAKIRSWFIENGLDDIDIDTWLKGGKTNDSNDAGTGAD